MRNICSVLYGCCMFVVKLVYRLRIAQVMYLLLKSSTVSLPSSFHVFADEKKYCLIWIDYKLLFVYFTDEKKYSWPCFLLSWWMYNNWREEK